MTAVVTKWEMWNSSEHEVARDETRYIVDADPGDEDRSIEIVETMKHYVRAWRDAPAKIVIA